MKKSFYFALLLITCLSTQAQQVPNGYNHVGGIATPNFSIEKSIVISPDGKYLVTRHNHTENRKISVIDVYDIEKWKKVKSFEIKKRIFAVNGFFEEGDSNIFYLTGLGYKMHKFDIADQEHHIIRLRKLTISEGEKFRTVCGDPLAITIKENALKTHSMEGKYIIKVSNGKTNIYLADEFIKITSVQQ